MDAQVLKSFMAHNIKLAPGEIVDISTWNIGRVQKLINQRYIIPLKAGEGKIEISPNLDPMPRPKPLNNHPT